MSTNCPYTPEELRQRLTYDPETGELRWLERPAEDFPRLRIQRAWNARHAGNVAGTVGDNGYIVVSFRQKRIRAHRIAWAMHYGEWPDFEVDHINGDRADNRIANLRSATRSENGRNIALRSNNTSGRVGVSWMPSIGKWRSYIRTSEGLVHLGCFQDFETACEARSNAEAQHGYLPGHGRSGIKAAG